MKYRFLLLNLKTLGMKCIEKEYNFQFANKDLNDVSFSKASVKAIYGTNGEGKTAIAHTLELYKNSVISDKYLIAESSKGELLELINQKLKKVNIDIYFAIIFEDGTKFIFHHIIEYKENDGALIVLNESLYSCKGNKWGTINNEEPVFFVENGVLKQYDADSSFSKEVTDRTMNLLSNCSAVYSILNKTDDLVKKDRRSLKSRFALLCVSHLAYNLSVFIDNDDYHRISSEKILPLMSKDGEEISDKKDFIVVDDEEDKIDKILYEEYLIEIKKIEEFLKVFKPDLKKIDVKKIGEDRTHYYCHKILVYKDGTRVSTEYESTGVKKLIRLFNYLNSIDNGGIVFIDEFDSNIHDVYLCKLIEYAIYYTNGQLAFTTHNLGPMELLSDSHLKHTIDFVNGDTVSSWKKNGNYSVVKVYRNGMIPNSPFNIDAVNFVKVFGGRE